MFLSKKLLMKPGYNGIVLWNASTSTNNPYYARDVNTTWNQGNLSFDNINSCVYGNGTYVAVGTGPKILTSTDGLTWTAQTYSTTATQTRDVCWDSANSRFLAIDGVNNAHRLIESADGITWSVISTFPNVPKAIIAHEGTIIALASIINIQTSTYGIYSAKSTDGGLTWSSNQQTADSPAYNIYELCYANGHYVFLGKYRGGKTAWASSTDGLNWTITDVPGTGTSSAYNQGIYLATDGSKFITNSYSYTSSTATFTRHLYQSTDGITWTEVSITGTAVENIPAAYVIAYTHNRFSFNAQGYSVVTESGIDNFTLVQTNVGSISKCIK